jgi:hypothetical protein
MNRQFIKVKNITHDLSEKFSTRIEIFKREQIRSLETKELNK